jgi:hypothetical protein
MVGEFLLKSQIRRPKPKYLVRIRRLREFHALPSAGPVYKKKLINNSDIAPKGFLNNYGRKIELNSFELLVSKIFPWVVISVFHIYQTGEHDFVGSEHKVNSQSYAGEIHIVCLNKKYGEFLKKNPL